MGKILYPIFKILSILFPVTCIGCRTSGFSVCNTCLHNCSRAVDTPFTYITSVYSFKDSLIRKIIHSIKYFHRRDLIPPLVHNLATTMKNEKHYIIPNMQWIIVSIPMPRFRKYLRGYNQAELIARELARELEFPIDTKLLIRTRSPKRQVKTATRTERIQNQNNSFRISQNVINKNIILVDDVTTTGATLHEARRILLEAGAHEVRAVTLAH